MKLFTSFFISLLAAALVFGCSKKSVTSSASLTIEPGTSIGLMRSGMTMQQVQGLLGKPDRTTKGIFEYQKLGLIIMPTFLTRNKAAKERFIGNVMCVNYNGGDPVITPFAGHTKEGIGIGSNRADVVSAYGEPPTTEHGNDYEILIYYKTHGMNFVIKNDKVNEMTVFLSRTN